MVSRQVVLVDTIAARTTKLQRFTEQGEEKVMEHALSWAKHGQPTDDRTRAPARHVSAFVLRIHAPPKKHTTRLLPLLSLRGYGR